MEVSRQELDGLRHNVDRVRAAIAAAAGRAGRDPAAVTLIAVTKYVAPALCRALLDLGVTDLGESRPQQLVARAAELASAGGATPRPRWHLVGHLQRNKARLVVPHLHRLHSLETPRLAGVLDAAASAAGSVVGVLIEVNVAGEANKDGVTPEAAAGLALEVTRHPHLRMCGLMAMAPYDEDPEASRPHFARLRALRDDLRPLLTAPHHCEELSMGMSQDFTVAIEEGATHIRVGATLFEGLPTTDPR